MSDTYRVKMGYNIKLSQLFYLILIMYINHHNVPIHLFHHVKMIHNFIGYLFSVTKF